MVVENVLLKFLNKKMFSQVERQILKTFEILINMPVDDVFFWGGGFLI